MDSTRMNSRFCTMAACAWQWENSNVPSTTKMFPPQRKFTYQETVGKKAYQAIISVFCFISAERKDSLALSAVKTISQK